MSVSRRHILLSTSLSAGWAFLLGNVLSRSSYAGDVRAAKRLRQLVRHPASARAIGLAYLSQFPEEADPTALARLIMSSLSLREQDLAMHDDQSLRALLAQRSRADFEQGCTVNVAGWILSRTEVRLCGLHV